MKASLDESALAQLFTEARTQNGWLPEPVSEELLRRLYALASLGPTSQNCQPMRLVFLTSPEARQRLVPTLMPANVEKTRQAPVTVIVACDTRFFDFMPQIWHRPEARERFASDEPLAQLTAFKNASIQGGFLIMAARSLGLDCGPMTGFDADKVNAEFFPDGRWTANFLCNLGYGDPAKVMGRQRRLDFDEACRMM